MSRNDQEAVAEKFRCRLYLITPPQIDDLEGFAATLDQALAAGDVACLQLRLKDVSDEVILQAAEKLTPIAHKYDVAFIMNDRPDLAKKAGSDGVHIGQDDMPYVTARAIMGDEAFVGVTCHNSKHLAMDAGEAGADYVAFGAFYPTTTKEPKAKADIETLAWWASLMEVPCVAIGGITADNAEPLVMAGADFLAVSAGVWAHDGGPAEAVKQFNDLFDRVYNEQ